MGPMPHSFARRAAKTKGEYFKDGSKLDWPPKHKKITAASKKEVKAMRPLEVRVYLGWSYLVLVLMTGMTFSITGHYTSSRFDQRAIPRSG